MNVQEALFTRRSIRKYEPRPIDPQMVETIVKAGMYAPSAVNKQPWHFIVFSREEIKEQIIAVHPSSKMLAQSPVSILVCYDEQLQHDEGYGAVDCSAATQNMLLCAHDLGLGACWVGIYPRMARVEALKEIFRLPEHVVPFSLIALGYPAEEKPVPDRFRPERIHFEKW